MKEFFEKIGKFFTDTWNNNPEYIYIVGGAVVVI